MKRILIAGVLACLMTSVGITAELVNPSFEQPDDPENWVSDQALAWGRWGNWINRETGWSPRHSGDCVIGYHHWRIEEDSTSGIYQDVEGVPAGTECTFDIFVTKDDDTNCDGLELRIEPLGGGDPIASASYRMNDISKSRWKLLTVTGITKAEGLRVLIIVTPETGMKDRSGALKFDDAKLTY